MPLFLIAISDLPVELKSNVFEERRRGFEFFPPGTSFQYPGLLAFNISTANVTSTVNLSVKINGVEIQRLSFKNQPTCALNEVFQPSVNLTPGVINTMEFEIIDTPLTETSVIKISDIIMWITNP